MGKTKRWIKNNLLFLSQLSLFLSIVFTVIVFYNFRIQGNDFNTRVAHIYLGHDESQYENIMVNAYDDFSEQADYKIVYQNKTYQVDLSNFEIATDEIIEVLVENQNNHAYFNVINESDLIDNLENAFGVTIVSQLSTSTLINAISNQLSVFNYIVTLNLETYFTESYKNSVLINSDYQVNDAEILDELPSELNIEVLGNSTFSILETLNEYDFSNETLSYIASILVDISLESHFQYFSFYQPQTNPSWLETDIGVKILKENNFDLVFNNHYAQSYLFELILNGSSLEVNLIGSPYINSFDLTETSVSVPYDTIYEDDPTLVDPVYMVSDDETQTEYEKLETPGENGEIIRYVRTITYSDSSQTTYELFYSEIKEVINEVILRNLVEKVGD